MHTRRGFLGQTAAVAVLAATPVIASPLSKTGSEPARIKSVIRRDETILRLGGRGDDYHMTWADNDQQYVAVDDGTGWFDEAEWMERNPSAEFVYNTRLWAIKGGPRDATFHDLPGYPTNTASAFGPDQPPRYYGFGTLAMDECIYQFLSTWNHPVTRPAGGFWEDLRWAGAKLIFSPDDGRNWCNQDGSSPVVWPSWGGQSRENMIFFKEQGSAFSAISILQMGKNYEFNRDGYVYLYGSDDSNAQLKNLFLCRVPKTQILDRRRYQYFSGLRSDGSAAWSSQIEARSPVHQGKTGWLPSVTYNAPLQLYMMANSGDPGSQGFSDPSYLGMWTAPRPWGPWTPVLEEHSWTPGNDPNARPYQPQIAPKWIAEDGLSFWLAWTDAQQKGGDYVSEYMALAQQPRPRREDVRRVLLDQSRYMPYYSFNVQRVDLLT